MPILFLAMLVFGAAASPLASTPRAEHVRAVVADATATPAAVGDDPTLATLAAVLVAQAQSGALDRTLFNVRMNASLTPALVASVRDQLAPFGKPTSVAFASRETVHGYPAFRYRIVWPARSVDESFALDRDGKIAGWRFMPSQSSDETPPAATPSTTASPTR